MTIANLGGILYATSIRIFKNKAFDKRRPPVREGTSQSPRGLKNFIRLAGLPKKLNFEGDPALFFLGSESKGETNMRYLLKAITIALVVVSLTQNLFAATVTSGTFPISANVDGTMTLNVQLKRNTPTGPGAVASSLAFGNLKEFSFTNPTTQVVSKTLRSSDDTGVGAYVAVITVNSHQTGYQIRQTGTELRNALANKTIPTGACVVKPVYATQDNGGQTDNGVMPSNGFSWVGTDKVLYTNSAGSIRTIQAIYSITDDPNVGASSAVPLDQAGGAYSGTVTFTATTI